MHKFKKNKMQEINNVSDNLSNKNLCNPID